MEIIDDLTQKVEQAAHTIIELKKERRHASSELDLLRNQLRDYQNLARENERYRREHEQLRSRLLRLQKKIDKHLLVETTLASQMSAGVTTNEDNPQ